MYFPVAGIELSPWIPTVVSFVISFFTSMGGVSGAFLLLPFQMSVLGFNSPAVSATNQLFNIVATPGGVYRFIREGRMVWPLTWAVITGTLPGVLIGAILRIQYLPDPKKFKLFVGLVLLYIGSRMLIDLFQKKQVKNDQAFAEEQFRNKIQAFRNLKRSPNVPKQHVPQVLVKEFNLSRIIYEFHGRSFEINTINIMLLCFIVGIIGGVYGVGGGSIVAPFFVSIFGLPVYTVAGAALMGTFVTSVGGVIIYQIMSLYYPGMSIAPDYALGFMFGIGGIAGMYCGARFQKFVPAKLIKWILAICILFPAVRYIWEFIT